MVFSCEQCSYETSRKIDFARHQKRKYPYKPKLGNHNTINESPQKVTPESHTLPINNNTCSKCVRCFARKDSLTRHLLTCDGLHPLQCRICLKIFARKQSKYKDKLYVKCVSPPSSTTQIINNGITYFLT